MDSDMNGNSATYFNAEISDTVAFKTDVEQRVINHFIPDTVANDSFAITQLIERSITAALEPYLIMDDSIVGRPLNNLSVNSQSNRNEMGTFIYPNPTSSKVNILFGNGFNASKDDVVITMNDIYGRKCFQTTRALNSSFTTEIDISKLSNGIYNCTIFQNGYIEHCKISKL